MTGSLIAYALVNGLKAYEAGAVMDLVTYHKSKWTSRLCCGFALIGGLQEVGSSSRSPLTRAHAHREIPSKAPFLGYNFQFDALAALFNLDPASLVTAFSVLFCQLYRGFSGVNERRLIKRRPAEGLAKPQILSFGDRRRVT